MTIDSAGAHSVTARQLRHKVQDL